MNQLPEVFIYNDIDSFNHVIDQLSNAPEIHQAIDALLQELAKQKNVRMRKLDDFINIFSQKFSFPAFAHTIGIGDSGVTVARAINEKTKWFPSISTVPLRHLFFPDGDSDVIVAGKGRLIDYLDKVNVPLAIVDDTLWGGKTLMTVIDELPSKILPETRVFCLQALRSGIQKIQSYCPVTAAVIVNGSSENEATIIKASELFRKTNLSVGDQPYNGYSDYPGHMKLWFGAQAMSINRLAHTIQRLLPKNILIDALKNPVF